jgi:hypothetical protein
VVRALASSPRQIKVAGPSWVLGSGVKLAKSARAGIRRYQVVDIPHRTLHDASEG